MKKVYFSCSITAGRDYAHHYPKIVEIIKANGLHVLSEAFADQKITSEKGVHMKPNMTPHDIWKWDVDWVKESDCVIAEVSLPSLGIGYEIAKAHQWNKPVLALFHKRPGKKLSEMIAGSPNVTVFAYDKIADVEPAIAAFLKTV